MSKAKCHVGCRDVWCRNHDMYTELTDLIIHNSQLAENTDWNILHRIQYHFLKKYDLPEVLSAEQVLDESDGLWHTMADASIPLSAREFYKHQGYMAPAMLSALDLEPVMMYRRRKP